MGKVLKVPPNTLSFITRKNPTRNKDDAPHVQPYIKYHMFRPPKHITRRIPSLYKKVDIALHRLDYEFPKISKHPDARVKKEKSLLKTIKKQRHNKDRRLIPGFKNIQEGSPSDKGSIRRKQPKKKQPKKKQPKKKNTKTKKLPLSKKKRVKRN